MAKTIVDGLMYIVRSKHLRGAAQANARALCEKSGLAYDGYSCLCTAPMARDGIDKGMWEARHVKVAPLRYQGVNARALHVQANAMPEDASGGA